MRKGGGSRRKEYNRKKNKKRHMKKTREFHLNVLILKRKIVQRGKRIQLI
jgi:hypothetical protein